LVHERRHGTGIVHVRKSSALSGRCANKSGPTHPLLRKRFFWMIATMMSPNITRRATY
jgi:hypothetical protein